MQTHLNKARQRRSHVWAYTALTVLAIGAWGSLFDSATASTDASAASASIEQQAAAQAVRSLTARFLRDSPQQCQVTALARPAILTGAYVGGYVLNNNHYEIRVSEPIMPSGCKGTVTLKPFQQKQELGDGLSPKLEWVPYGFRPDSTVITHGQERVVMRAARLCWSFSIGGGGDGDLKRHTEARPAVRKTWRPQNGIPVSVTYSGTARTVCK
jgi:hypothetical protein